MSKLINDMLEEMCELKPFFHFSFPQITQINADSLLKAIGVKNEFVRICEISGRHNPNYFIPPSIRYFVLSLFIAFSMGCNSSSESVSENSKNIVFLISKDPDNYEADRTIPVFAQQLEDNFNFKTEILLSDGPRISSHFPNMSVLDSADLLVVFCRRLALPDEQMDRIKKYVYDGNPVMGIRTANHAFSIRSDSIPEGYSDWWDFVPEVLGHENQGYGPVEPGTDISVVSSQINHPILQGLDETYWHTIGNLYKVKPLLDKNATILLRGTVESEGLDEPVAWTRETDYGGKVFYSSAGHPADFENKDNVKILTQAVAWLTKNRD